MRRLYLLSALLGCCAATARAAEPNQTFATRTILAPSVRTVSDLLTPGFVEEPDTLLGLKDHFGDIYFVDDDGSPVGNGLGSGVGNVPTNSGSIDFCVTGVGDDSFSGSHGISGQYEVFVDVYDFFGDPVDSFSETRTLTAGAVHDFSFSDFEWLNGSYDVYIDNTVGPISGGDVDFFTFTGLSPGVMFTAETFDPTSSGIDTLLGWFDAAGGLIADDDDSGSGASGLLSKLVGTVPAGGTLTFAVTGFEDELFTGAHVEDDPYELRLTVAGGSLPGDFNNDTMVNGQDLAVWRANFGQTAGADADGDSDTDGHDFLIWQRQLGGSASVAAAASVPEPHAGALFAIAAVGLFRRLRR
jgi:hypothetical protein